MLFTINNSKNSNKTSSHNKISVVVDNIIYQPSKTKIPQTIPQSKSLSQQSTKEIVKTASQNRAKNSTKKVNSKKNKESNTTLKKNESTTSTLKSTTSALPKSNELKDADQKLLITQLLNKIKSILVYPAKAQRMEITGTVYIQINIDKNGNIISYKLDKSSGSSILDNAAIDTVKKILATKLNTTHEVLLILPIRYQLE
ncbi:MAG: energy transducer TonB [Succinivibrionaceae bacterium]